MEEKRQNQKKLIIVIAIAVALIGVLIALYLLSDEDTQKESIVLPDASIVSEQQEQEQLQPESSMQTDLVSVTNQNAQKIVASLVRPTSYHQVLRLVTVADDVEYEQTADVWISGQFMRTDLKGTYETKSFLTDAEQLYLWYDEQTTAHCITLSDTMSYDDLIGIPSYEMLLDVPQSQIKEADFVSLAELGDVDCIFVSVEQNGCSQYFWIGLDSGLICKYTMLVDGELVYTLQQMQLSVLADSDEALNDIFVLPDGTEPFSTKE